jgi:hypothetical protein
MLSFIHEFFFGGCGGVFCASVYSANDPNMVCTLVVHFSVYPACIFCTPLEHFIVSLSSFFNYLNKFSEAYNSGPSIRKFFSFKFLRYII